MAKVPLKIDDTFEVDLSLEALEYLPYIRERIAAISDWKGQKIDISDRAAGIDKSLILLVLNIAKNLAHVTRKIDREIALDRELDENLDEDSDKDLSQYPPRERARRRAEPREKNQARESQRVAKLMDYQRKLENTIINEIPRLSENDINDAIEFAHRLNADKVWDILEKYYYSLKSPRAIAALGSVSPIPSVSLAQQSAYRPTEYPLSPRVGYQPYEPPRVSSRLPSPPRTIKPQSFDDYDTTGDIYDTKGDYDPQFTTSAARRRTLTAARARRALIAARARRASRIERENVEELDDDGDMKRAIELSIRETQPGMSNEDRPFAGLTATERMSAMRDESEYLSAARAAAQAELAQPRYPRSSNVRAGRPYRTATERINDMRDDSSEYGVPSQTFHPRTATERSAEQDAQNLTAAATRGAEGTVGLTRRPIGRRSQTVRNIEPEYIPQYYDDTELASQRQFTGATTATRTTYFPRGA